MPADDTLPLYDLNGLFVRRVTVAEAEHMVALGNAEKIVPGGWRDRRDVEWTGVKLVVPRDYQWSPTALTSADAQRAAEDDGDPDFQARFKLWRFIGDTKAVRVCR